MLLPKRPFPPAKTFTIILSFDGFDVVLAVFAVLVWAGTFTGAFGSTGVMMDGKCVGVLFCDVGGIESVLEASSGVHGIGIHKDEAVGVVSLGLAAVKPHAKPAVKVAARMTTRPILQLWLGARPSRLVSGNVSDIF